MMIPILTNIFQMGWFNHRLDKNFVNGPVQFFFLLESQKKLRKHMKLWRTAGLHCVWLGVFWTFPRQWLQPAASPLAAGRKRCGRHCLRDIWSKIRGITRLEWEKHEKPVEKNGSKKEMWINDEYDVEIWPFHSCVVHFFLGSLCFSKVLQNLS